MAEKRPLHLPKGLNYSCIQCGRSCSLFDEMPVDEKSQRHVEEVDWRSLVPEEYHHAPPWKPPPGDTPHDILRTKPDGSCIFYRSSDRLCSIHAEFSPQHKPQACHDFPYRFVETPGGVYVGLSFACTAVLANTGTPVEEQREALEAHHPRALSRRIAPERVALTARHEISWDAYLALDDDLRTILQQDKSRVGESLAAQSVYIDLVIALLRQARNDSLERVKPAESPQGPGERFPADSGTAPDTEVLATVRQRYLSPQGLKELLRLARLARPSPALQRAFLGLITAFRQNLAQRETKPSRLGTALRIFGHYGKHMAKLGKVRMEGLGGRFGYDAFKHHGAQWEDNPEQRELLRRFFAHCVERKDLLLADNVWLGQRMQLMHYALIRWYTTGRAALDGEQMEPQTRLAESIRDVERFYAFHSSFDKLFRRYPMLGMMLDGIVRRPVYAATMVGGAV